MLDRYKGLLKLTSMPIWSHKTQPSDSFSDCHNDLAGLFVGFHVLVGIDNGTQRKGAINDRFQRAGFETVVNKLLAAGKPLRVLYNFKQGITSYG